MMCGVIVFSRLERAILRGPRFRELGVLKIGALEIGALEKTLAQIQTTEIGSPQIRLVEIGSIKEGPTQIRSLQVGPLKQGKGEICVLKFRMAKISELIQAGAEIRFHQPGSMPAAACREDPAQASAMQMGPLELCPLQF
jgi:hypothetical protein